MQFLIIHNQIYINKYAQINNWKFDVLQYSISAGTDLCQTDCEGKRYFFAVITDKGTYQACEAELKAYQEILGKEGLPTFIIYNEWKKPEDVKKVITKLYKRDKLEGVIFVGNIPIPMLRKAQHMTSAFKMDEKTMIGEIPQYPVTVSTMTSIYNSIF